MRLRNNSKNEWLNFFTGQTYVDIKAESEFEVGERDGAFILRLLGHENWVVEVKEEPKEVGSEKTATEALEEIKELPKKEEEKEEVNTLSRPQMMKELKKRGIKFTVKMKNGELLALLK